jgi:hypothetical protein
MGAAAVFETAAETPPTIHMHVSNKSPCPAMSSPAGVGSYSIAGRAAAKGEHTQEVDHEGL